MRRRITIIVLVIIAVVVAGVLMTRNDRKVKEDYFKEKVLAEQYDSRGRLIKRVVTGRIPGEDTYLTINRYDSTGKRIQEYGAQPYGAKYKTAFLYDNEGRITEELMYAFPGDSEKFKHALSDELYSLEDTLMNFAGQVAGKIVLHYDSQKRVIFEDHFTVGYDSVTKKPVIKFVKKDTVQMLLN